MYDVVSDSMVVLKQSVCARAASANWLPIALEDIVCYTAVLSWCQVVVVVYLCRQEGHHLERYLWILAVAALFLEDIWQAYAISQISANCSEIDQFSVYSVVGAIASILGTFAKIICQFTNAGSPPQDKLGEHEPLHLRIDQESRVDLSTEAETDVNASQNVRDFEMKLQKAEIP